MNFKPLHNRVLVRRVESKTKTPGGIIIPEFATEKSSVGEVVAVGDGSRDNNGNIIPMSVKVGDKVLFGKYDGVEINLGDEKLLVTKETDVLGIL